MLELSVVRQLHFGQFSYTRIPKLGSPVRVTIAEAQLVGGCQ